MNKQILFEGEASKRLISGVNKLADAVKVTLGAGGNTVIIEDVYGNPHVTKDGVTVAKYIAGKDTPSRLEDPVEHMAALILCQAATKTASEAGDGTTTATILAQTLVNEGKNMIDNGYIASEVKRGMDDAVKQVISYLKSNAIEVTDDILKSVASISANNDAELGKLISDAFIKVGKNGVVTHEESKNSDTYVDFSEGMEIERGYLSRYYVTDTKKNKCVLDNPLVILSDVNIQRIEQIMPLIEYSLNSNRALFIVSDMEDNVLNTLTVNRMNGMAVGVIKPPMFGVKRKELLEDMSILCGAKLISEETGDDLSNVDLSFLGEFKKVVIGKSKTTMINSEKSQEVLDKIALLQESLSEESDNEFLKERIAKLDGGVGIIYVGASSEAEMKEKRDRVDDAVSATKAALEEGIVSGGGVSLYDASFKIEESKKGLSKSYIAGINLIKSACLAPINQIISNSGKNSEDVVFKIWSEGGFGYGYDVKNEKYGNMVDMGIIDPLKVTRNALENASSVASTILSTKCTVTNIK